jgi:hypothetical protein
MRNIPQKHRQGISSYEQILPFSLWVCIDRWRLARNRSLFNERYATLFTLYGYPYSSSYTYPTSIIKNTSRICEAGMYLAILVV